MTKPLFWLLTALLLLAIVEVMARLTHHWLYDGESLLTAEADAAAARVLPTPFRADLQPFYGTVGWAHLDLNMPPSSLNSRRLATTLGGRDTVVVGLLGGSVAAEVAGSLAGALLKHFASSADDTPVWPVFIDLAHRAYRQPQQSIVFANRLADGIQFDIVISLDGFNEVTHPPAAHEKSGTHPNWPLQWSSVVGASASQLRAVAGIMALREEQRDLTAPPPVWQGSALFDLARRHRLDQIDRLIVARHFDLAATSLERHSLRKHGPLGAFTKEDVRNVATETWYRSALFLAELAEWHGAVYYHFLQPNQYVPGTKPLSDSELANAYSPTLPRAVEVREGYPKLAEYGVALREQDVKFFDLSHIFADHHETLYADRCCHLNRRGNELMAEHMLRRILDDGALDGPWHSAAMEDKPDPSHHQAIRDSIAKGEFGAPLARSVFDVYRRGRTLAYLKRNCTMAHITPSFFVHFTRTDDIKVKPRFHFTQQGAMLEGNICVATFKLPDLVGIKRLHTGQFWAAEGWSVNVDVSELNTLDGLQGSAADFDGVDDVN